MTAVFVHGVPETAQIWDKVRAELSDVDSAALSLPGFGVPVPDGFGATMDEYASWLIGELEMIGEPVDLVGHDWGGLLVGRVISLRPDVARSWVSDLLGAFDPAWEWHAVAKIWQTPREGEEFVAAMQSLSPEDQAATFTAMGVPDDDALAMARAGDATMGDCILKLYRSAVEVEKEWGPDLGNVAVPGLVLAPAEDPFSDADRVRRMAERTGARVATLDGVGHFWPYQAPERGAAVLRDFWAG